jgi:2-hydroxychromene-2-carboxylate isomerase
MRRPPRFYFSFHSPYSWMASRLLEERLPEAPRLLEYVPYFLPDEKTRAALIQRDATMHYGMMSKPKHLYILQDTKRLAQRFGFPMKWPIDIDPWWELPHLAWLAARRTGDEHALFGALLRARWERGENICDRTVLIAVAESIGLDGERLAAAADDPEMRTEGVDALERGYLDDVFGVPYFLLGPHRFWGLDRLDDFLAALRQRLAKEETR